MQVKVNTIIFSILGLLFLGACGNNQPTNTASSPATNQPTEIQSTETQAPSTPNPAATGNSTHGGQGGQVVETGKYHLELVPVKEAEGIHLDFYLQEGDDHVAVPNANVTAQVQFPDGSQKSFNMKYDTAGKHYYTVIPTTATGEYRVAVLSEINGEKVNARYTFK